MFKQESSTFPCKQPHLLGEQLVAGNPAGQRYRYTLNGNCFHYSFWGSNNLNFLNKLLAYHRKTLCLLWLLTYFWQDKCLNITKDLFNRKVPQYQHTCLISKFYVVLDILVSTDIQSKASECLAVHQDVFRHFKERRGPGNWKWHELSAGTEYSSTVLQLVEFFFFTMQFCCLCFIYLVPVTIFFIKRLSKGTAKCFRISFYRLKR